MVGVAGVGVTPGPSHRKSGVPVTPVGRVTEQVRVTVSPAMMVEEGEEVREMVTGTAYGEIEAISECKSTLTVLFEGPDYSHYSLPITLSLAGYNGLPSIVAVDVTGQVIITARATLHSISSAYSTCTVSLKWYMYSLCACSGPWLFKLIIPIVTVCTAVSILGSVLEVATTVME